MRTGTVCDYYLSNNCRSVILDSDNEKFLLRYLKCSINMGYLEEMKELFLKIKEIGVDNAEIVKQVNEMLKFFLFSRLIY